jgi:hypothetical protein
MDTTKIVQERLPETQYIRENTPKKQIYIHHTAGNKNAVSTIKGWANNKERVATAFVIGYEGTIAQAFSSTGLGLALRSKRQRVSKVSTYRIKT